MEDRNPLCKNKPHTFEHVLSYCKTVLGNGGYTWRHSRVLNESVRIIGNFMKSEPTISTKKFVAEGSKIYTQSKQKTKQNKKKQKKQKTKTSKNKQTKNKQPQTNIVLYLVKILDQVEIRWNLPTFLDGIIIVTVCDQILFFCHEQTLKSL